MGWSWSVFGVIGYERLGLGGEKGQNRHRTFPDYNEGEAGYVTETDVDYPGLMQYAVYEYM